MFLFVSETPIVQAIKRHSNAEEVSVLELSLTFNPIPPAFY